MLIFNETFFYIFSHLQSCKCIYRYSVAFIKRISDVHTNNITHGSSYSHSMIYPLTFELAKDYKRQNKTQVTSFHTRLLQTPQSYGVYSGNERTC